MHQPRAIAAQGVVALDGWRFKLYTVQGRHRPVPLPLVQIALATAGRVLPRPPVSAVRYGVGFVIVHEAEAFDTIVIDWWENVNELRHRVFRALPGSRGAFSEVTATGESVCVWELRIQSFERDAWVSRVLSNELGPQLEEYSHLLLNEIS